MLDKQASGVPSWSRRTTRKPVPAARRAGSMWQAAASRQRAGRSLRAEFRPACTGTRVAQRPAWPWLARVVSLFSRFRPAQSLLAARRVRSAMKAQNPRASCNRQRQLHGRRHVRPKTAARRCMLGALGGRPGTCGSEAGTCIGFPTGRKLRNRTRAARTSRGWRVPSQRSTSMC